MISRVKGTQDFLDLTLFNFMINEISDHLILYHYREIATPILEQTELFQRSLGMETDVVSKEMFLVKMKDEEQSICLRPENTAGIVRAFIENHVQQLPWKVFSFGPMFRYERPQKGRYRQFHQCSLEVIGSSSIAQDAQLILMLDRLFHERFGLTSYALHINFLGCFDDRVAYKNLLKQFLKDETDEICALCKERAEKNSLRIFDCKNSSCQLIYQRAPELAKHLCQSCNQEWEQLQEQLELLSVSFSYRPSLVRGLDYYNKTVFEFVSTDLGAQNAFCGGGRYDQLVSQLGGKEDLGCVGAAIGIERLLLLLEPIQNQLPLAQAPALHVIIPLDDAQQTLALLLADELRAAHLATDVFLEGGSIKSMMRKANQSGARFVLILGQEEQEHKEVTVKNMMTGSQERIPQVKLVDYLKR